MKKHERSQHGKGPLQALVYWERTVRSLFQGVGKAYFEVVAVRQEGGGPDLLEALRHMGISQDRGTNGEAAIAIDKD